MNRKIISLLLIILLSFNLVACSKKVAEENVTVPNDGGENIEATEPTNNLEGTTLKVIVAHGGKEQIFGEFTKKTGIKVEFLDMSSGEALARLEAEGGTPVADVWFGGGLDSFITAKDKGLLEQYASPETKTMKESYKDKDGYWTGMSLVTVGFLVNNDVLKEKGLEVPTKWSDVIKPEYKDEVLMADPSISGTNYALINSIIQVYGEEEGWKYLEALSKNVPFFAQRGGEPPKKVAAGEIAVGIIPMSGEYVALHETAPVTAIYPEDGIPWVPAGLAIFKNSENLDGAKAFIDWALSIEGQEVIRDADPRVMGRPEVAIPAAMKDLDTTNLMDVDILLYGEQREEILNRWAETIAK